MKQKETFLCIDLKSFYASVECVERGLDPFTTNLVVADPDRSVSTICLAITPAMKKLGIRNRCRIHEIPDHIEYIVAKPRMQLYMEYSARIYGIYLNYVAKEDIHVYSVDECFMDVTRYLSLYHLTAKEMAQKLMDAVMEETGITATAGIGTNLYLAKIAMDIVAKHIEDHIGMLDEISYREQLWGHKPLSDFWRIGSRTERKLAGYGIQTMGDIALASIQSEDWLYKIFGIDAELLIDHAWGCESCKMSDIKNYHTEEHSLTNGQVLMRNYTFEEAAVVVREMTDVLVLDLVEKHLVTDQMVLTIGYDIDNLSDPARRSAYHGEVTTDRYGRKVPKHGHGTIHLADFTSSSAEIIEAAMTLYDRITSPALLIRRLNLSADHVIPENQVKKEETYEQLSLFSDPSKEEAEKIQKEASRERERRLQTAMLAIKDRYGKNAILRGTDLEDGATTMERNNQIGGHKA